jgi:hypothetical protein
MKTKALGLCLTVAAAVTLAACSSSAGQSAPAGNHATTARNQAMMPGMVMPDGSTMAAGSPGTAPSEAAKMICTDETRNNITTVLAMTPDPRPVSTWRGGTYTCTYRLPAGTIVLSVHESADVPAATAYTTALRPSLRGAKDLNGLSDLAFGTANGVVALQKDNDTLRVDTSGLTKQSTLYAHRADFAYEIAAVIMGCWTGSPVG